MDQKLEESKRSPMMQQWYECKQKAPLALLFFRLGDFYEAFYDDAVIIAKELDLTLTHRQDIPMCGVPWHTQESYVDKLVLKGYHVAMAEQLEDPKKTKGIVKRDITRIVTPGTVIASGLLQENANNFLASIAVTKDTYGIAFIDVTTATFFALETKDEREFLAELFRQKPKEILVSKQIDKTHPHIVREIQQNMKVCVTKTDDWFFDFEFCKEKLYSHFNVLSLDGFGFKDKRQSIIAAGSLLRHIQEQLLLPIHHIQKLFPRSGENSLSLDRATLSNLEITEPLHEDNHHTTLLYVLDETKTPMGARLLKQWLKSPLIDVEKINRRQEAIESFHALESTVLDKEFSKVRDLERLVMRIKTGLSTPRDFVALASSLFPIPHIKTALQNTSSSRLQTLLQKIDGHIDVSEYIRTSLNDSQPLRISDGNVIRFGFSKELDELRAIKDNSNAWLLEYQMRLQAETQIKTLKVGYNKMFGYFVEVSRGQADKMPSTFERRQTLVNQERFTNADLREFEQKIVTCEDKILELETSLFQSIQDSVAMHYTAILRTAQSLAEVDVLYGLSLVAKKRGYVRPVVDTSTKIHIEEGRHPVIETLHTTGRFIENDVLLNTEDQALLCITGPNMGGKSTFIRQVALICIMAQIGSFVPCKKAHIGVVDKLFSRVGASDDIARGHSTFMVEMTETASILNQATSRSLVILDEIGRGTSTYDGISLAWAVAEFLLQKNEGPTKTLFATHYYELTELEEKIKGFSNFNVTVADTDKGIVFLRKVIKGRADRSWGIHVAKLAGLPQQVIRRAEEILSQLEQNHIQTEMKPYIKPVLQESNPFKEQIEKLITLDLNATSPLEAFKFLMEWQDKSKNLFKL